MAGILSHFLPESPKFLMSRGRNAAALEVFQEIYRRNHNPGEFPIKSLADEKYVRPAKSSTATTTFHNSDRTAAEAFDNGIGETQLPVGRSGMDERGGLEEDGRVKQSHWIVFKEGISQMMTIFQKQYIRNCLLVFTIQFGFLWSQNTLRLWLPSLLSMVTDYENSHEDSGLPFDLCEIIESVSEVPQVISPESSWNNTEDAVAVCSQVIVDLICFCWFKLQTKFACC